MICTKRRKYEAKKFLLSFCTDTDFAFYCTLVQSGPWRVLSRLDNVERLYANEVKVNFHSPVDVRRIKRILRIKARGSLGEGRIHEHLMTDAN